MKIIHKRTGKIIAHEARIASTTLSRMKGLMFIDKMDGFDALILDPGNSIHNCFVRFSLDVIFVNNKYEVVKIIRDFKPWRFSWIYFRATKVIELQAGSLIKEIKESDVVEVQGV